MTTKELKSNIFSIINEVSMLMPIDWVRQNSTPDSRFQSTMREVLELLDAVEKSEEIANEER